MAIASGTAALLGALAAGTASAGAGVIAQKQASKNQREAMAAQQTKPIDFGSEMVTDDDLLNRDANLSLYPGGRKIIYPNQNNKNTIFRG